jgi:TM2 domain-containing membrane protein YozV
MPFCDNCGAPLKPGEKFCGNCGAPVEPVVAGAHPAPAQSVPASAKTAPEPVVQQPSPQAAGLPAKLKNTGLAAAASFLFSGLGQVYNGSLVKGLIIFFGTLVLSLISTILGFIVVIYGTYDAYTTAKKMNEGTIPFVDFSTLHIIAFIVVGIIVVVIYVLVVAAMTGGY